MSPLEASKHLTLGETTDSPYAASKPSTNFTLIW